MSQDRFFPQLPLGAARYLAAVKRLEQPVELVDSIMAEVEATPQIRVTPDLRTASRLILAAAAVILAFVVLLRLGTPNVGPAPTPVPLDQLPSAGEVQARFSIEADDVPAAFGHGFIWLTNATTGELVRMNPNNGSIATPVPVTEPGAEIAIALTDASVWVTDGRDSTLVQLDPASLEERGRIPVSAGVTGIFPDDSGGSGLWLLDRDAGVTVRVEASDGSVGQTVPISGSAFLVHGGWAWVAVGDGTLARINRATGAETGRLEIGIVADRLVADGDSVLAVAPGEPIVRVGIGSLRVESRGVPVLAAVSQNGQVWAVLESGHIVRLDPESLQPVAASAIDLEASGTLAIGGGWLWTSGSDAAGDASLLRFAPASD